jgi:hypothetical protein
LTPSLRTSLWVWACLGFFLLSRAPAVQCPFQLDVDEGQMLAQAMRYQHNLTPWQAVDGETGGPLLSWVVLLGHEIGLPFNFRALHFLAALCLAGTLLATFAASRELVGETAAVVGLAAGAWWLALAQDTDFTHYSSELVPCLLISGALAALVAPRRPDRGQGRVFLVGLLLGLVPWAKLQAVPEALALGLWALAEVGADRAIPASRRARSVGFLLAGALLPSAVILAWVVRAGAWDQFSHSYLLANLSRAEAKSWVTYSENLLHLLFHQLGSPWFQDTALLAIVAGCLRGRAAWRALPKRAAGIAALLLAAAVFAILSTITQYPHYQQLCLMPLMLAVGCCARVLVGDSTAPEGLRRRSGWAILALGLLPLPAVYFWQNGGPHIVHETWHSRESRAFEKQATVDSIVRQFASRAQSLAIWGWVPYVYVDLGIPPATRDAGYASLMDGNPSQEFMRASFMRDLEASAPDAIVDAEDYILRGRRRTDPSTFPALAAYLAEHYQLVGRGTAAQGPDFSILVDVYLRRRLPLNP